MSDDRGQFLRFAAVGVAGFLVDVLVLYLALLLGLGLYAGRALSFLAAVQCTWELNRRFTFVYQEQRSLAARWWRYLLAMLGGGIANYLTYSAVVVLAPGIPFLPLAAVAAGSLAGLTLNFLCAKFFVFYRS